MIKVVVLMGVKTPEHEVSLVSGWEVVRHLDKKKYKVLPVVISRDGERWQLKYAQQILLHSPAGWNEDRDVFERARRSTPATERRH